LSLSLYEASVPVFTRGLLNLSTLLRKAAAHGDTNGIEHSVLVNSRLAPDMYNLARQVQAASDAAKGCVARLAGVEVPKFVDDEQTFSELEHRIAATVGFIESLEPSLFEGTERLITLNMPTGPITLTATNYLLRFSLPNFFFHVATAHGILRNHGVKIGKADYLGDLSAP
jgi:hypothetical protein